MKSPQAEAQLLERALLQERDAPSPHVTEDHVRAHYEAHQDTFGPLPEDPTARAQAWQTVAFEIRQQLFWRFAGTVFTGLGQIAPDLDDFDDDNLLWSAGFGLRFRLTEQNRMNYRADAAWGRDGFEFYFSLTEAF